jgi:hypothetical protein
VFSQSGEDRVLEHIFLVLGHGKKRFVELGEESGVECNTRRLRESFGWTGLIMDGKPSQGVHPTQHELRQV